MMNSLGMVKWLTFKLNLLTTLFAILITVITILMSPWKEEIATYSNIIVLNGFLMG